MGGGLAGGVLGALWAKGPFWERVCGVLLLAGAVLVALASQTRLGAVQVSPCAQTPGVSSGCDFGVGLPHFRLDLGDQIVLNEPLGGGLSALFSVDWASRAGQRILVPADPLQLGIDVEAVLRASPPQPLELAAGSEAAPAEPVALPEPPGATQGQAGFILTAAQAARESQRVTGVPASVTIAQAILESSWGGSKLSSDGNNFFGIKGRDRPGTAGVVWFDTWEVIGGRNLIQHEPFRAYDTPADSFVDHGRFFLENPRYAAALAARGDPREFAREINRAGYATDPNYAPKLIALMDRFDLYAYDL